MPSTAIRKIVYDTGARKMWVTFTSGRRYIYEDVAPEVVHAFQQAESRGAFFNHEIRDHYSYREVTLHPRRKAG
ncbi:MAG TPA: KTSC domain-containing protein [Afipia sp.]